MYRLGSGKLIKHLDFILIDLLCLQVAFVLAYAASGYGFNPYTVPLYARMALFVEVLDFATLVLMDVMSGVLKRGPYSELTITLRHGAVIGIVTVVTLFLLQQGQHYSRMALVLTFTF